MSADLKFHRWIDPSSRRAPGPAQSIEATEAERASLARWLDIPSVRSLKADLLVTRTGSESADVTGRFVADVELVCGVSIENFAQTLSGEISRSFRKPHGVAVEEVAESAETEIDLDAEEPGEWRPQGIDLGAMLAEELSLALPDFPRKPDAVLEEPPENEADEPPPNPFAALGRLKDPDGRNG